MTENNDIILSDKGNKIIRNHMLVSMGIGLIPVPMVDMVGITGAQLNMMRRLAQIYEVPFTEHKLKTILTSLIGGGGSLTVSSIFCSLIKVIPVVGQAIGEISMPITAGAITYALGKVFLMHFATGGTLLTFKPEEVRAYYAEMLKEGKTVAASMKS
ncbi:MAG: DUF697 domain-containing protein [Desulfobacteraceae bacterium]|nr:DUF697 domain-containing protein [Desulfobacteraceae bacterium]